MIHPTVLVVDDDPSFRRSLRQALESRHLAVIELQSGAEVLRIVQKADSLAALVVGSMLSDTTGVALLARLGTTVTTVPAVLVCESTRGQVAFQDIALEMGARFTASRTDDIGELADRIELMIGQEREGKGADPNEEPKDSEESVSPPSATGEVPPVFASIDEARERERELEDEFADLIATYVSELPIRFEALERAVIASKQSPGAVQPREAARLAHRLRGSAGSYGFTQISQAAGWVEDALRGESSPQGSETAQVDWERVHQSLEDLRKLVTELAERF